jgi:transcription termination factor Rho
VLVTIGRIRQTVTDTSEQTLLADSDLPGQTPQQVEPAPPSGSSADSAQNGGGRPAKRRGESLSSMLLPELQELAGTLGIATTRMRKSDLVAAIQSARGAAPSASA